MGRDDHSQNAGVSLCGALGIGAESSHGEIRKAFLDYIAGKVRSLKNPDDKENLQQEIAKICALYFDYNRGVVERMAAGVPSEGDYPDARKVKIEAGAIIKALQKTIVNFTYCELELYTTIGLLEADIAAVSQEAAPENTQIEWTFELPHQIAVACRRRDVLSGYMVRMRRAKSMVEKLDIIARLLDKKLPEIISEKPAKKMLDEFYGHLRNSRFSKAQDLIKKEYKKDMSGFFRKRNKQREEKWKLIREVATLMAGLVKKISGTLASREGKLFLRNYELELAYETMERQLQQNREFVAKYQVPEIKYRIEALKRQQEKLYEIGSFESFLEIMEKMQKGCAFPMKTMKDVRAFEADCYNKATEIMAQRAEKVDQTAAKIAQLSRGPEAETVPDDELYGDSGMAEVMKALG